MSSTIDVIVAEVRQPAPDIRTFRLEPCHGGELPAFSPGSHVVLELPVGGRAIRNAYSLTGSPFDRSHYRIAVRRQAASRGGSRYLHEQVSAGQVLRIGTPVNYFPFEQRAGKLLLIAGGIGITPFMSLVPMLRWYSAPVEMHYAFRHSGEAAFLEALRERLGDRLRCHESASGRRLDVDALLAAQPAGTQVYVCGPQRLIDAVCTQAAALGWPSGSVRFEQFAVDSSGLPFQVALQRDGRTLRVEAGESLLEALERHGIPLRHLCRAGVCGECRTGLLAGEAEHRDLFLSDAEKAEGRFIMPCVSRAGGDGRLVLDL